MSTTMAPPGRPRPRPKPRFAASTEKDAKLDTPQTAGSSKSPIDVLDEEDAMFMRNRNMSLSSRKKFEEVIESECSSRLTEDSLCSRKFRERSTCTEVTLELG